MEQPNNGGMNLTQYAYERLRDDVLSCQVRPGDKLKIHELAARLGVSQGAVREALSRLTSDGLVVAEPQKGFRASPVSAAELRDLTRVRVEIESLCLRRAIELGNLSWESELLAAYHALSKTPEKSTGGDAVRMTESWADLHRLFHEKLIAACDSPHLLRIRAQLFSQAERYRRMSVPLQSVKRDTNAEHQAILQAAIERNTRLATALLATHFEATTEILLKGLRLDETASATPNVAKATTLRRSAVAAG